MRRTRQLRESTFFGQVFGAEGGKEIVAKVTVFERWIGGEDGKSCSGALRRMVIKPLGHG
jgi:hypothetical protein